MPKWTYERLITEANRTHGDKYDYSKVDPTSNISCKAKVPIICKKCNCEWSPSVVEHVRGTGCPRCSRRTSSMTCEMFINESKKIHGDKYDYSEVTPEHIKNTNSKVPITCSICGFKWNARIRNHMTCGTGCPWCAGTVRYTLENFIKRAQSIHGDRYDYSLITESDMANGCKSKVRIVCNICKYMWLIRASSLITKNYGTSTGINGCPSCLKGARWDYTRFIDHVKRSGLVKKYDYSLVKPDDIKGGESKVPVICRQCGGKWYPSVSHHLVKNSGCLVCCMPHGELKCSEILTKLGIEYITAWSGINTIERRLFDFCFMYNNIIWLLEYDGGQHFTMCDFFHKTYTNFLRCQLIDTVKTFIPIYFNYRVIRIDYTQINNIEYHILKALELNEPIYFSTPEMYSWMDKYVIPESCTDSAINLEGELKRRVTKSLSLFDNIVAPKEQHEE